MPAKMTVIKKARFNYSGISAEQMLTIGNNLLGSIKLRIRSAINAQDQPAKPLKINSKSYNGGYPAAKERRGIEPVRNWTFTGGTLTQMIVKEVTQNRGVIAFANTRADNIAHWNNMREKAFGVSPTDKTILFDSARAALLATIQGREYVTSVLTTTNTVYGGADSFVIPSRRSRIIVPKGV